MPSELWQRIRAARQHANMTQQQLGEACGVSREAVSQWEASDPTKRNTPGMPRLRVIGSVTQAPLEWLMSDESDIEPGAWLSPDPLEHVPPPDSEVVDVPVFSRRKEGSRIEEPRTQVDKAIGSLLFRRDSLARKGIDPEHVEVHYAADNAMAPRICKDAAVLLDGSQVEIIDGRVYVVDWGGQEQIRRLYRELDGRVRVVADNTAHFPEARFVEPDAAAFRVLGRVCWVGAWED